MVDDRLIRVGVREEGRRDMLETLRKKARKSHVIRAVISLVAAIAILIWTKFAVFDVITGASDLDVERNPALYEWKYVSVEADAVLSDYVEHTTTTTRKYGGSSTSTDGYSYIVLESVPDYANNTSTWYFYSVYMRKSEQSRMNLLMNKAWDYLEDETGTVAPPDTFKVKGTWTPMEADMERYFRESLADMGLEEGEYDKFYFYNLETDKLGGQYYVFFWVLQVVALALILYAVYNVIGIFGTGYAAAIHKYLRDNSTVSLADIDADFETAHPIGKETWVGRRWTVFIRGTKASIVTNRNLIWGYYFRRTGRNSVSEMRLYTTDGKITHVSLSEEQTKEALGYYANEQPQMILGYSDDLEKTWQKNFPAFMDLKYRPVMSGNMQQPGPGEEM